MINLSDTNLILEFKKLFMKDVARACAIEIPDDYPVAYQSVLREFDGFRERQTNFIPFDFKLFSHAYSVEHKEHFVEMFDEAIYFRDFIFIGSDNYKNDIVIFQNNGKEMGVLSVDHELGRIIPMAPSISGFIGFVMESAIWRKLNNERSQVISSECERIARKHGINSQSRIFGGLGIENDEFVSKYF